jgi:hypothetical protein
MNKFVFIFLGIVWGLFGILIIIDPKFYSWRYNYYFDFTGYNIPLGIFMIVVGGLFIWTSLRKKKKEGQ